METLKLLLRRIRPAQVVVWFWILILAFTLLLSVRTAYRQSLGTEEYAYACDAFGYLRMAKETRRAAASREFPQYKLESPQTRLLINLMQSRNVPLPDWEELVAPHAHHYFPESGFVGVQYPPGTGLILAMFPEAKAVYGLNLMVVVVFSIVGLFALFIAAWKQCFASAGLVVLALYIGLEILGRIGSLSFSINTAFVPILLSCLLVLAALWLKAQSRNRLAFLSAVGAGLFLGLASLIRLPAILFASGFLILLWPKSWRVGFRSLPSALVFGVIPGLVTILINQQVNAGAWYVSTYARADTALPTLEMLKHHFRYYFVDGHPAVDNWVLVYAFLGFCGFLIATYLTRRLEKPNRLGLTCRRLSLAAFVLWAVPSVYFLTHAVTGIHYSMLTIFAATTMLAFGSLGIEATSTATPGRFDRRNNLWWLALALVLFTGLATLHRAWSMRSTTPAPAQAIAHPRIVLPPDLSDERAWVWADLLTGSLWYYDNKPAFKIQFSNTETRAMVFRFVFDRGEPQYLIQDSDLMQRFMDEIVKLGGTLEPRGKVDGKPYYLVQWPSEGPRPNIPPS